MGFEKRICTRERPYELFLANRLTSECICGFDAAPDDAVKSKERRFSLEEYQRPAQNIAIKKPLKISMLNIDSLETAGSLGSTPPNSPSMASPSTCKCKRSTKQLSIYTNCVSTFCILPE